MKKIIKLYQCPYCREAFSHLNICEKHLQRGCLAKKRDNIRSQLRAQGRARGARAFQSKGVWRVV